MKRCLVLFIFLFCIVQISYAEPGVFKDPPPDVNFYEGEFERVEARSAEYKVIYKCWGNIYSVTYESLGNANTTTHRECAKQSDNILPAPDKSQGVETLTINDVTYYFNLRLYYEQDTVCNFDKNLGIYEALALLTDHNLEKFMEIFKEDVIDKLVKTGTDKKGNPITVPDSSARAEARAKLDEFVEFIRNKYGNMDLIEEGYKPKEIYMYHEYLNDIENTIFARHPDGYIIAIKTDKFNDVFQQHLVGGIMTDIINSSDIGLKQYRFTGDANGAGIGNFYLCEKCSKCEDCDNLVASGIDENSETGLYFSKYCANHACAFVWDWVVDPNNSGATEEGLKCSEKNGMHLFCVAHTCRICVEPIVGVSVVDASSFVDSRATGEKKEEWYSNYCAEHKCRTFSCRKAKTENNTTSVVDANNNMISNEYCSDHNNKCNIWTGNDICGMEVTKKAYDASGNDEYLNGRRMICERHLEILNRLPTEKRPNNIPPKFGRCAYCGEYLYLEMNSTYCNACITNMYYEGASEFLDFIYLITSIQNKDANVYGYISPSTDGLIVDVQAGGTTIFEGIKLNTWRTNTGAGLYLDQKRAGKNYYAINFSCIGSFMNLFGSALNRANAELYMGGGYLISTDEEQFNVIYTDEAGVKREILISNNLGNRTGACIDLENLSDIDGICGRGNLYCKSCIDLLEDGASPKEIVDVMNMSMAFNTKPKSGKTPSHTTVNTGVDCTITLEEGQITLGEGQTTTIGKVFISFELGDGIDRYASPKLVSYFVAKNKYGDDHIYRVPVRKDPETGEYVSCGEVRKYNGNVCTAFTLDDNTVMDISEEN